MVERGVLADVDLFLHRHLARDHHVAAAAVELDDLDRDVLSGERIQIMNGARIGLRSGHEGLDAHIHRQPALDPAQHAAGDDELLLVGLLQVVPDAQSRGARVRQQHIPFRLLAVLDHHIHGVAGPYRNLAAGSLELLDGDDAFALVPEIDDDILGGDTQDRALQNLVGGGRGEVAVIVEKILVAFGDPLVHLPVVLVYGHYASADH